MPMHTNPPNLEKEKGSQPDDPIDDLQKSLHGTTMAGDHIELTTLVDTIKGAMKTIPSDTCKQLKAIRQQLPHLYYQLLILTAGGNKTANRSTNGNGSTHGGMVTQTKTTAETSLHQTVHPKKLRKKKHHQIPPS